MMRKFQYVEVAREEIVDTCKALASSGRAWHFHSLPPGCAFSPRPEGFCFVIEDTDLGETFCVFSAHSFVAECQDLVQVLHGEAILSTEHGTAEAKKEPIVKSATEAFEAGEKWHHHMMKPGCVLSPDPKRYVITLESEGVEGIEKLVSDQPLDDTLREIELLYFRQYG